MTSDDTSSLIKCLMCEYTFRFYKLSVFSFQVTTWVALVRVKRRKSHNLFSRKKQLALVEALPRELNLSKGWSFCGSLRYDVSCWFVKRVLVNIC